MSIHQVTIEEQATGSLVSAELDDALPVDALFDIEDAYQKNSHSPTEFPRFNLSAIR